MIDAELSTLFFAVTAFAVFFVGLAKAGFGGMMGSLGMPLVAAVSDMPTAIAILLPTYIVIDVIVVWLYRRSVRFDTLWPLLLGGLIGIVFGGMAFRTLDPTWLRVGLGMITIGQALRFGWHMRARGQEPDVIPPDQRNWSRILGWGGASGFLSFFLMGGAPAQIYLLPFRLAPHIYVGIMVWHFAILNVAKLPFLFQMDLINGQTLMTSALFLPFMPAGILLGRYINNRIPKQPFYVIVHVLLFALGIYLILSAFM
ncbi:MAG: sulfite exporter TauE/SafE family protein [Rhodobacteraceae bacterium]|nr:sulfite exporter TauE/SafE family protein [Paracoccaceae bacterium]